MYILIEPFDNPFVGDLFGKHESLNLYNMKQQVPFAANVDTTQNCQKHDKVSLNDIFGELFNKRTKLPDTSDSDTRFDRHRNRLYSLNGYIESFGGNLPLDKITGLFYELPICNKSMYDYVQELLVDIYSLSNPTIK
jgi:hypothetical protein